MCRSFSNAACAVLVSTSMLLPLSATADAASSVPDTSNTQASTTPSEQNATETIAAAQPEPETAPANTDAAAMDVQATTAASNTEAKSFGLNFDLGFASAYVFRGANVFAEKNQLQQNMMLAPGMTWSIGDTGLSLGYWGAFQISGQNIDGNIDAALGAEQDLLASYAMSLPYNLGLAFGLACYIYPGSDTAVAGAPFASYVEPSAEINYSSIVDAGLKVAYFFGVQDVAGIRGISYLYVNPYLAKSFDLTDSIGLSTKLSYGYKQFLEGNDGAANIHDITLNVGLPIHLRDFFYFSPSLNLAWTDMPSDPTNGFAAWAGLNVGTEF